MVLNGSPIPSFLGRAVGIRNGHSRVGKTRNADVNRARVAFYRLFLLQGRYRYSFVVVVIIDNEIDCKRSNAARIARKTAIAARDRIVAIDFVVVAVVIVVVVIIVEVVVVVVVVVVVIVVEIALDSNRLLGVDSC